MFGNGRDEDDEMKAGTRHALALVIASLILLALLLRSRSSPKPVSSVTPPAVTNQPTILTKIENPAPASAFPPPAPVPEDGAPRDEIVGIGAVLSRPDAENGVVQITKVLPNSPAEAAGLFGPLNIYKVDGISLHGVSLQQCVAMLRGAIGTKVRLELGRPFEEEKFQVEVTRQRVIVPNGARQFRRIQLPEER